MFQKTDPLDYFDDNFGKYGQILRIFSLSQQENYGTQNLSYFSHLTFIMLPLYLEKQTDAGINVPITSLLCLCIMLHFNAFNHLHRLIWAE